jgi:hypothetical protein
MISEYIPSCKIHQKIGFCNGGINVEENVSKTPGMPLSPLNPTYHMRLSSITVVMDHENIEN